MATRSARPVRVLVAVRGPLYRQGIVRLLDGRAEIEVVCLAVDGLDVLARVPAVRPDVVLMDLEPDGLVTLRALTSEHPALPVVILSGREHVGVVIEALRSGARGYLLEDSGVEALVSAVLAVHGGGHVMSEAAANCLIAPLTGRSGGGDHDGLTARELEILTLVAGGNAYKQVAVQLRISHKTVRAHVCHIYGKLSIYDRSQMVRYALRKGLVAL
jgi:DNA-binding NarL/FixJ family response regulator